MKEDYYESEEFKELLNSYEETKKQGYPSYLDEDDYADLSDYFMNKGNADQAMECANEGLDNHPDSVLMQSVKSGLLIFFHRYEEAREIIDLIPEETNNLDVFYQRAQLIYALDKDADTAEEMFSEWIELQKKCDKKNGVESDENIRDSYIHVITSLIELAENRQYDEELVKRWIEEYLVIFSSIGSYNSDIILSEIVREERFFDMVEKVYLKIVEYDPYSNMAYTNLATAQNALGKITESIESCNFALAIDARDWEAKAVLAHNYFTLRDFPLALKLIEEVHKEYGDASQSLFYSKCLCMCNRDAECYEQLKNAEEYMLTFKESIPDFFCDAYWEIADTYMMTDHNDDAIAAIDAAISVLPDCTDYIAEKGVILAHIGKDMELANRYLRESIDKSVDKFEAAANVALRLLFCNVDDLSLTYFNETLGYKPMTKDDLERLRAIPAYLAHIYYKKKDLEMFMPALAEACDKCPDVVENLFGECIPKNVTPDNFYNYLLNKLNEYLDQTEEDNTEETK